MRCFIVGVHPVVWMASESDVGIHTAFEFRSVWCLLSSQYRLICNLLDMSGWLTETLADHWSRSRELGL
jgi:hypothetical protein